MGEVASGPKSAVGLLSHGQVLPKARDAIEMVKRLRGGLSRVPTTAKQLLTEPVSPQQFRFNPTQVETMERMYQEANPVFKQMEAAGMFKRTLR